MSFSPATAVYAAEVIRFAREFNARFALGADEAGLAEILDLGPGANYLASELTMHISNMIEKTLRRSFFIPE